MLKKLAVAVGVLVALAACTAPPAVDTDGPVTSGPSVKGSTAPAKAASKAPATKAAEVKDAVKITRCAPGEFGVVEVKLSITNNAKAIRSYWVTVAIYDETGKTRIGEGNGVANKVEPGTVAKVDAYGFTDDKPKRIICKVVNTDVIDG